MTVAAAAGHDDDGGGSSMSQPMTDHPISVPTSFPPHPASSRLVPPRSDKNPQRNLDLLHRDDSLALNYTPPCRTRKRSPSLEAPPAVPPSFVDSILQARR